MNIQRIERRDRPWVDSYVAALCGPFAMPPVDTVRAAVRTLTDRYPHSRLDWRLNAGRRRWITGGDPDSLVVERDWTLGEPVATILHAIAGDNTLPDPLALIRCPDFLGLRMSASIGDGRMFNTIFSAVVGTALSGEPAPWDAHPRGRFPLGRALVRTFGRRPSLVRAAITDRPPLAETPAAGPSQPWKPARRTAFASIPAHYMDDIVARARQSAPGVTRAAVQMWVLLRSLRLHGLRIAPEVNLIADLRRYLDGPSIDGNFVAGVPLRVDPGLSLPELSATIRATMASGRPLATQALTTLRRGGPVPPPDTVDPGAPVRVTFSGMGRPPEIAGLPFLAGPPAVYTGGVEPDGPTGLTLLISETPATVSITASFHDNVIDAAVVSDALRSATSDPLGVLDQEIVPS